MNDDVGSEIYVMWGLLANISEWQQAQRDTDGIRVNKGEFGYRF